MDPISAIGLASSIITFIDSGVKVVKLAAEIYEFPAGLSEESRHVQVVMTEAKRFANHIQTLNQAQLSAEEKALCQLADECKGLSQQIIDLVQKAQASRKSWARSVVAGLRLKWSEGDRRRLEERLIQCRGQLDLQLTYLQSSNIQTRLDALFTSAKDDSCKLESLSTEIESIRQGAEAFHLSREAQDQIRTLLGISEQGLDAIVQQRVLDALAYDGMYSRYETVNDSHLKTLRWVFSPFLKNKKLYDSDLAEDTTLQNPEDAEFYEICRLLQNDIGAYSALEKEDSTDDNGSVEDYETWHDESVIREDEAKASARMKIARWLSSGTGVFHIAGKAGSGKSTLMKYLCENECTKTLLQHWAGDKTLVFASFFFWKPGSRMQKSMAGLFKFLLHEIFTAQPELIKSTMPDYWAKVKSIPWQNHSRSAYLSDKKVQQAFTRLISDEDLNKNHCFCFFIDALDEYDGSTPQQDVKLMVDSIHSWSGLFPENIKICVSSREYNVFENAFSADQRIRLQNLTGQDLRRYVRDMLAHMPRKEELKKITNIVVDNAEGIFLWVVLVVRRIREQIEDGASFTAIKEKVLSLPNELADLLRHILNSLKDPELKEACCIASMVLLTVVPKGLSLSLISYSYLQDYLQDREFASREQFQSRQRLNSESHSQLMQSMTRRLNGCCKGLLEAVEGTVRFTHRSVPEFLSSQYYNDLSIGRPVSCHSRRNLAE